MMRRNITILCVLLYAASAWASYGILVNGTTYYDAEYKGKDRPIRRVFG